MVFGIRYDKNEVRNLHDLRNVRHAMGSIRNETLQKSQENKLPECFV